MSADRNYGKTKSGQHITEELIDKFVEEAERGYEPGQLSGRHRGPGQPPRRRGKNRRVCSPRTGTSRRRNTESAIRRYQRLRADPPGAARVPPRRLSTSFSEPGLPSGTWAV